MASIFVLDIPEYAPLIDHARACSNMTVASVGNYLKIEAAGALVISREPTRLSSAVWFGGTAGIGRRFWTVW